ARLTRLVAAVNAHRAVAGRTHRDVGDAAVRARDGLDAVLVGRAGEERRRAAAAGRRRRIGRALRVHGPRLVVGVVPGHRRVPGAVRPQLRPADRGDERVAVWPGGDAPKEVVHLVGLVVGGTGF